jgi:hypothetical protein
VGGLIAVVGPGPAILNSHPPEKLQAASTSVETACCSPQNAGDNIRIFCGRKNYFQKF